MSAGGGRCPDCRQLSCACFDENISTPEPRRAGRELDAAVAEEVCGWVPIWHADIKIQTWRKPGSDCVIADRDVPAYSSSIVAAWLVVERLHELGWQTHVVRLLDGYAVTLMTYADVRPTGSAQVAADTAPLAICRAALAAVRGAKG